MMSTNVENSSDDEVCASCGIAAVDDVQLKKCACNLLRYCGVDCQRDHRPLHKKLCKKRLAELRDKALFTQPDGSHLGECPICFLPLSIDSTKSMLNSCCSKRICNGCSYANKKYETEAGLLKQRCVFCREPLPGLDEEHIHYKNNMERAKKNDPNAMFMAGMKHHREGGYETAMDYLTKAAALGHALSHYQLHKMYHLGEGVQKDKDKEIYHLEEAAMGGHPVARDLLGCTEMSNCRFERAKKHFIIAAKLGYHDSLEMIKCLYKQGNASKEDYASALRAYQAAVDATKSQQREEAEAFF